MISHKLDAIQNVSKVFTSRRKQKNITEYQKINERVNHDDIHQSSQFQDKNERIRINNQTETESYTSKSNKDNLCECCAHRF